MDNAGQRIDNSASCLYIRVKRKLTDEKLPLLYIPPSKKHLSANNGIFYKYLGSFNAVSLENAEEAVQRHIASTSPEQFSFSDKEKDADSILNAPTDNGDQIPGPWLAAAFNSSLASAADTVEHTRQQKRVYVSQTVISPKTNTVSQPPPRRLKYIDVIPKRMRSIEEIKEIPTNSSSLEGIDILQHYDFQNLSQTVASDAVHENADTGEVSEQLYEYDIYLNTFQNDFDVLKETDEEYFRYCNLNSVGYVEREVIDTATGAIFENKTETYCAELEEDADADSNFEGQSVDYPSERESSDDEMHSQSDGSYTNQEVSVTSSYYGSDIEEAS